jgi:hypothetical protein
MFNRNSIVPSTSRARVIERATDRASARDPASNSAHNSARASARVPARASTRARTRSVAIAAVNSLDRYFRPKCNEVGLNPSSNVVAHRIPPLESAIQCGVLLLWFFYCVSTYIILAYNSGYHYERVPVQW